MNSIMPVICYLNDLAAAVFTVGCYAAWTAMKGCPLSSGPGTDPFFAHVARGLSFVAACSLAGFTATAIMRVSPGMRPQAIMGFILLPPVCAGLIVWFGIGRRMHRLKKGE